MAKTYAGDDRGAPAIFKSTTTQDTGTLALSTLTDPELGTLTDPQLAALDN